MSWLAALGVLVPVWLAWRATRPDDHLPARDRRLAQARVRRVAALWLLGFALLAAVAAAWFLAFAYAVWAVIYAWFARVWHRRAMLRW